MDEAIWTITMSDRTMAVLINLLALRFFVDLMLCRHFWNEWKAKEKGGVTRGRSMRKTGHNGTEV